MPVLDCLGGPCHYLLEEAVGPVLAATGGVLVALPRGTHGQDLGGTNRVVLLFVGLVVLAVANRLGAWLWPLELLTVAAAVAIALVPRARIGWAALVPAVFAPLGLAWLWIGVSRHYSWVEPGLFLALLGGGVLVAGWRMTPRGSSGPAA